jgi:hypothetical protein
MVTAAVDYTECQKKRGAVQLLFLLILVYIQALNTGVERYSDAECLLPSRSLSALELLRNFVRSGLFPGESLQSSHILCRPRTPFSIFHKLSPN